MSNLSLFFSGVGIMASISILISSSKLGGSKGMCFMFLIAIPLGGLAFTQFGKALAKLIEK